MIGLDTLAVQLFSQVGPTWVMMMETILTMIMTLAHDLMQKEACGVARSYIYIYCCDVNMTIVDVVVEWVRCWSAGFLQ